MVPHTFLDGIWYSIGHPLHAKLTCQAQKVVQFFFPHLCLPEVDEVHHSCVSESPHEDDRVRLVNLEQQVFEERTRGSEDHPAHRPRSLHIGKQISVIFSMVSIEGWNKSWAPILAGGKADRHCIILPCLLYSWRENAVSMISGHCERESEILERT